MPAVDPYASFTIQPTGCFDNVAVVTPSDTVDLATVASAVICSAAGKVKVTTFGGQTVTLDIAPSFPFPVRCTRIWATGTTATGIVAFW